MRSFVLSMAIAMIFSPIALAQPADMSQQLSAMELTIFGETYCKDRPIKRLERLEENFAEPSKQKDKPLQTRLSELMEKVQPTAEVLQRPDPCVTSDKPKKGAKSLFSGLAPRQPEGSWKERNYPFIDWNGKPIDNVKDGVAQLKTDYANIANGSMKYILMIKLPENTYPRSYTVTFLDDHGFKLKPFTVFGPSFQSVEGADGAKLWQAKEQTFVPEKEYKQARDYTVTANF